MRADDERPATLRERVRVIGLCSDANSSHLRGAADAPAAIRRVIASGASNLSSETGTDLGTEAHFGFGTDYAIGDDEDDYLGIEQIVAREMREGARLLILGGDHAVSFPVMRAVAARYGPVEVLHFDAHADIYEAYEGNRYSHASPFARIMEEGLARRLVQVGVRTLNAHQRHQIERYGVEVYEAAGFEASRFDARFSGPLYISFDLDALDPAFAPGVSHHEPGGLSVREALTVIRALDVPVIGADIVEYNPRRDLNDLTAAVALKLLKELGAKMLETLPGTSDGRTTAAVSPRGPLPR